MEIKLVDELNNAEWDEFVYAHPYGQIYHLAGWKDVLEKSFKHMKGYYFAIIKDGQIKSALPIFHVKSWITGNRMVSIPFSTFCDPLVSTQNEFIELFKAAKNLSQDLNASRLEIRAFESASFLKDNNLSVNTHYKGHRVDISGDLEVLKAKFHKTSVRDRIKRSSKANIGLRIGDNEKDLKIFYKLYALTRERVGLPPQPYIFFKMLWETFSKSKIVEVYIAEKDNKDLAGLMLYKFNGQVSGEYLGYDRDYLKYSPHIFLYWEAIKAGNKEGLKFFDLGRTSSANKGLLEFKERWATEEVDLVQFYYPEEASGANIYSEDSSKYQLLNLICTKAPYPVFLNVAKFCYRHMG